jgi:hypothetical protein
LWKTHFIRLDVPSRIPTASLGEPRGEGSAPLLFAAALKASGADSSLRARSKNQTVVLAGRARNGTSWCWTRPLCFFNSGDFGNPGNSLVHLRVPCG